MNTRNDLLHNQRGMATTPMLTAACGLAAIVALVLWTAERSHVRDLDRNRSQTLAALDQARSQIRDLTTRLNTLVEEKRAVTVVERSVETPEPPPIPRPSLIKPRPASQAIRNRPARSAPADPRLDRLQSQLAETQKELASTRADLARDREDLNGKINSTRDDLSGSIAKTHDEVVALQKRGEQNIYEFKLIKSKELSRVGPLSVALRSTSAKHKTYDLAMIVDDNELSKKHVNLYEPIWITLSNRPQPVQLVVNHLEKNEIEGYLSEPRYKKSELVANPAPPAQVSQPQLSTRDQSVGKQ